MILNENYDQMDAYASKEDTKSQQDVGVLHQ